MTSLQHVVERLCRASVANHLDPSKQIDWPTRMQPDQWFMSPEHISLYGTPTYEALDKRQRQRLSFYEAVNFFSLNIHGERPLIEGLAHRLYRGDSSDLSPYLHHFLDEENKHMMYFAGFCMRYAGKIYPDKKLAMQQEFSNEETEFLFYAKTLIFEELVDVYNRSMARDPRLEATARRINELHHLEERRHLAFGRHVVQEMFDCKAAHWPAHRLETIRTVLSDYLAATWREYYNPDVYRDAGLEDPLVVREEALQHVAQRERRRQVEEDIMRFLTRSGIVARAPERVNGHENEGRIRAALRSWIRKTSERLDDTDIEDDTRIFQDGILQSVHVMDLILLIEHLSQRAINVDKLETGLFTSVDTIYDKFFSGSSAYYVD